MMEKWYERPIIFGLDAVDLVIVGTFAVIVALLLGASNFQCQLHIDSSPGKDHHAP